MFALIISLTTIKNAKRKYHAHNFTKLIAVILYML